MTTTTDKLLALAQTYERKAEGLRMAAAELNGHATQKKQASGIGRQLDAAIALRREGGSASHRSTAMKASWTPERRARASATMRKLAAAKRRAAGKSAKASKRSLGKPASTPGSGSATRKATARFLARVATSTEPYIGSRADRQRVSPLLNHGYLRKEGDGYVRTDKPFIA